MKKFTVVAITLIASLVSNAQISVNVLYSTKSVRTTEPPGFGSNTKLYTSHHFLITEVKGGKKLVVGAGIGQALNTQAVGKKYTVIDWTSYPQDVYEKVTGPTTSLYLILGYRIIKQILTVNFNFGTMLNETYYNAKDSYRILSPDGYYYTSQSAKSTSLTGVTIEAMLSKNVSLDGGFDNAQGFKIGLGYRF